MTSLTSIEGIGEEYAQKLREIGIRSGKDLLERAGPTQSRRDISLRTGIPEGLLLCWMNHADLLRIKGIGADYAELLEVAGVDSPGELARRSSEKPHTRLFEVNQTKKLVRKLPTEFEVDRWSQQARNLSKIVVH